MRFLFFGLATLLSCDGTRRQVSKRNNRNHTLLFVWWVLSQQSLYSFHNGEVNAFVVERKHNVFPNHLARNDGIDRTRYGSAPSSISYGSTVVAHNAFRSSWLSSFQSASTITEHVALGSASLLGLGPLASSIFPTSGISNYIESTISSSSNIVLGQLFNGLAHISLDLLAYFGPATVVVRSAEVIGRICAMAADYIPDHYMMPEELAFQALMLAVACICLVTSLMPIALAAVAADISIRDSKAFHALFKPAGVTWSQFKALSVCAFDWLSVAPNDVVSSDNMAAASDGSSSIIEEDYAYWLYNGEVKVQCDGRSISTLGTISKDAAGRGLLRESRLLRQMESGRFQRAPNKGKKMYSQRTLSNSDNNDGGKSHADDVSTLSYPKTTIRAGPSGALLLRIHAPNLKIMMDSDPQLTDSIRMLLFQGMQAKFSMYHG